MPTERGKFVVISGPDGAGKTTLVGKIQKLYPDLIKVREPGGTALSEAIRNELLSDIAKNWYPMSQLLHYFGARANLLEHVIRQSLGCGQNIIADRFDESTFAYQVVAFGNRKLENVFWEIRERLLVDNNLHPDLYIHIDVPVEVGVARRASEKGSMNHLDKRSADFHDRVSRGLKEFFSRVQHKVVDGNQPIGDVLSDSLAILEPLFGEPFTC